MLDRRAVWFDVEQVRQDREAAKEERRQLREGLRADRRTLRAGLAAREAEAWTPAGVEGGPKPSRRTLPGLDL